MTKNREVTLEQATEILSKLTRDEVAYIAGIFDGEGCIFAYRSSNKRNPRAKLQVAVANTDKTLINWLAEKIPLGNVSWCRCGTKSTLRRLGKLTVGGPVAVALLKTLRSFLIVKAPQADVVLNCHAWDVSYRAFGLSGEIHEIRERVVDELKELKRASFVA